jgi:hypothetical protein
MVYQNYILKGRELFTLKNSPTYYEELAKIVNKIRFYDSTDAQFLCLKLCIYQILLTNFYLNWPKINHNTQILIKQ